MSYLLDKTNNSSSKITVEDGTIDNTSTSLTMIGRAYNGWGEAVNENFLALLENFASTSSPRNAVTGQLWYDTGNACLKYFDGTTHNTLAVYPTLSEGFLYNNSSNVKSWVSVFPSNATDGVNSYLQRTTTGALIWVSGTSLFTDALPAGSGLLTKNTNGTYGFTAAYTLPTASTSVLGGVKVDGTTISINSGVISAVSSGGGSSLPGNATGYLYNNGTGTLSWGTLSGGSGGSSSVDVQTFNSTGTWTKPSGYAMARIQVWGGGAGGGKGAAGRGGGGGGYNETTVPLSYLASTVTITVGAGGLGRTGTAGNGGNGGTSSVPFLTALTNGSTAIYAYGGSAYLPGQYNLGGGQLGINNPSPANVSGFLISPLWNGGAGGESANGCCGTAGFAGTGAVFGGGGGGGQSFAGGASVYGGAGGGVGGANGINGNAPAGGGMGSTGVTDGGNGAAGRVVITCWGGGGGSSLPSQTGNNGKYLTTDGSALSWDTPAGSSTGGFAQFGLWYKSTAGTETFTVPAGVTLLRVAISSAYVVGSAVAYGWVTVTPGQTISVTVGDGVSGTAGISTTPVNNGLSSFGTYLTASLVPAGGASYSFSTGGTAKVSDYDIGMANYIRKVTGGGILTVDITSSIPAVQNQSWTGDTRYDGWVIVEYGVGASGGGSSAAEVQTFNSTGTWTKPSGCKMARIQLWGGGGGGSRGSSAIGGAGGSYNEIIVPLSYLADTVPAIVGAGGAVSTVVGYGSQGGGGTSSSFALATPVNGMSTVYGYGGGGGSGPPPSPFFNLGDNGWKGGAGGTYDTGDAVPAGSSIFGGGGGGNGLSIDPGGTSLYGGAGGSSIGYPSTANFNGRVPGGGGVANGGNGAAGLIIVTCY